ncbi:GNAT family N-acetyltransferase [Ponticoccus sp. SC2-23]|uniref:GNAT family N-acetyltransferase n=1 Tax=Alexandriicola marinus TaxID=2081710 RepID=UPI00193BDCD1|nr:GNAT family N-acetyltransferase [Alexandriicola marinus]MBM1221923.1 GNAT family N-acetyltransferase [Ponticoccus sp. SC6-9]MBM1226274.1 GNAT family N-acetyltransferase [Ponticoccus sp. SC6-15]MBM1230870.1 GNAT family N-acetyltransferase [Ponticoccus sp. SC6-38]MBM1235289.1 GNAT family N-acetyltransferase [Ponticoccus sp. SC6-45]MBM1239892.1 GNAT family N-acetyltransferase [Ponticoccus sp. SC6-49]MBM1244036.1 GNAT family N-acetyltransferase [Ponticoccus sp. SC2-64]MBM1248813.1 GNAT family
MSVTPEDIYRLVDATWPPASIRDLGGFRIREGQGGGNRVSAATAEAPVSAAEIAAAEDAMRALRQTPLFMIRHHDRALDQALDDLGYTIKDPVTAYAAPVDRLMQDLPPPVTTFEVWPWLAIQREIWEAGGIGEARLAVMDRVEGAKTTILGRTDDRPAATAFVAMSGDLGMIHAIEVHPRFRRRGLGARLLQAAARWTARQGGQHLCLLVTQANQPANGLYASIGMTPVGHYHYRIHPGQQGHD